MSAIKRKLKTNVLQEAQKRISTVFDEFDRVYVSFSAGKDSTVMFHLAAQEAKRRNRKLGVLVIDLEAQYTKTIEHGLSMVDDYADYIELYWLCLPLSLRNAVSVFSPRWMCWEPGKENEWVRKPPEKAITALDYFDWFRPGMEFEELVPEFHNWYSQGKPTACMVGIRTDESLNRFRAIAGRKEKLKDYVWTTRVMDNCYSAYPIYDWSVDDIWLFHAKNPQYKYNSVYDYMHKAGLTPHQMRICQPYGDDQRKGLWLYHLLEPKTWYKVVARVNGVNSGSLYALESGNMNGNRKIDKPEGHTWKSFCNLLLATLPKKTQEHYIEKFRKFISWWSKRGYAAGIPDESPSVLEAQKLAPSYRRLCKVILKNDWWCKGLNFSQPLSVAYGDFLKIKKMNQNAKTT